MLKCKIKKVGYGETIFFICPNCGSENTKYVVDLGRITSRVGWPGNCWDCEVENPNIVRLYLYKDERVRYHNNSLIKC